MRYTSRHRRAQHFPERYTDAQSPWIRATVQLLRYRFDGKERTIIFGDETLLDRKSNSIDDDFKALSYEWKL